MEQMNLALVGGLCTAPLWFALPRRRSIKRAAGPFRPWQQIVLRLPIRRLIRAASHFIWTRPDGKQFVCRTFRQLVARVYDFDGRLLQGLLRLNVASERAGGEKRIRGS
ncbi:hypothetical protein CJ026_009040 [Ralstonia pickettii]|uniref:hypothetical protein n=1 Tax=Ralstonia pickettii TaxID=329 RepID=UPI000BD534EA|nr:hypothetical protein [Ralstonia pickettii]POH89875.1 hypothetical protein CJ026_009040 [Ralstonia pickettii]